VQEGDSIFLIGEAFGLSPHTVVWSNMEILQGAPWLLQPGLPLLIPPTDGAYHTVKAGESTSDIAAAYGVDTTALYNIWNPIEPGEPLAEGTLLVIPSGIGPDFDWEPPPPPTAVPAPVRTNEGVAAVVQAPVALAASATANGWFVLPTGSYGVSGYVFGDYRNPTHIGLDYRCRLGDPIYAADGGTVVFAGWGGGYGNLVRVDHGNGFVTYYAHFSSFSVVAGQAVGQGQVVGYCGTTGASTGPHLHYEIRLNGVPQNPVLYEP
jgi:murein DD-endopeptidase MepM/ murein hydrolase activator NlpD